MARMKKSEETLPLPAEELKEEPKTVAETSKIEHTKEGRSIDIYTTEGIFIRTYSERLHGKDYEKLAKGFIAKNMKRNEFGVPTNSPKYVIK